MGSRFGGRGRGMPPEVRREIVDRLRSGERWNDVAAAVGVSGKTIARTVSEAGGLPARWTGRGVGALSLDDRHVVCPAQLTELLAHLFVLRFKVADTLRVRACEPVGDVGVEPPLPNRPDAVVELLRDTRHHSVIGSEFVGELSAQPDCPLLLNIGVATCRRLPW